MLPKKVLQQHRDRSDNYTRDQLTNIVIHALRKLAPTASDGLLGSISGTFDYVCKLEKRVEQAESEIEDLKQQVFDLRQHADMPYEKEEE